MPVLSSKIILLKKAGLYTKLGMVSQVGVVHVKPPWLNFEKYFLLFVSPRRLFFFNSSSKFGMNHVYLVPIAFQVLAFLREPLFRSPLPSADGDGL
jgi:hypothetical protein